MDAIWGGEGGIGTIECIYDMFRVLPKLYVSSKVVVVDLLIIIHRIRLLQLFQINGPAHHQLNELGIRHFYKLLVL